MLKYRLSLLSLLLLSGLLPLGAAHAQEIIVPPPPPPADALEQLIRDGDAGDPLLVFPGFGATVVDAASFELVPGKEQAWQDMPDGKGKALALGDWRVELRQFPADWKTLRAFCVKPVPKDEVSVRKILWSGLSAWLVDLTRASGDAAGGRKVRQRYLIGPVAGQFLVLSFNGPAERFTEERNALLEVAKSVRFRVNGVLAEYHSSENLDSLRRVQVDSVINFDWESAAPNDDVGPESFSIRWSGKVRPRNSETYTFTTASDDGVRLWVNGQPLVDNWTVHAVTENSGTIALEAGKEYDLKMEWYEHTGLAVAQLYWESPGQLREIVPAACLACQPEPFFALPAKPPTDVMEGGEDLPPLLYGDQPGGYVAAAPAGLKWVGTQAEQHLALGTGKNGVQVTLKKFPAGLPAVRAAMPSLGPENKAAVQAILWQNAPAWRVDCELDPQRYPEVTQRCQRYYLVPLKRGLLLLSFTSALPDWSERNRDGFLAVFKSISLTAEADAAPAEAVDSVF